MLEYEVKDTGTREEHESGAVRDQQAGKGRYELVSPIAMRRLAIHLEKGAEKYEARNWERGFPLSRMLGPAFRHLYQYLEGLRDEDHLAAAVFNIFGIMHFEEMIERDALPATLADLPSYVEEKANGG